MVLFHLLHGGQELVIGLVRQVQLILELVLHLVSVFLCCKLCFKSNNLASQTLQLYLLFGKIGLGFFGRYGFLIARPGGGRSVRLHG